MSSIEQELEYEARVKRRYAILAAVAAVLLVAAAAIQLSGPHAKVNELTIDLLIAHKRYPLDLIGAAINGLGLLALAGTLNFLFIVTRSRKPQMQNMFRILAIVGAVLAAIAGLVYAILIAQKANEFATTGNQTYQEANNLTSGFGLEALPFLGQFASLLLAAGFVFTALNAMRVGLLTKFMGYLGIFTGVLVLIPLGSPVPIVQGFWLIALAYLFSGHWPTGLPPSWESGIAEPWPSSFEKQQRTGGRGMRGSVEPAPAPAGEPVGAPTSTRATTPKRKRKRRH
jgi:hypothetical protein